MSQVHRVINLREPFKLFGMTIRQIGWLAIGIVLAFAVASRIPGEIKIANIPAGFWVGLAVVCMSIVVGSFTDLKPLVWWRNMIAYRLGLLPTLFIPKAEDAPLYPDPTIIERSDAEEFYVGRRDARPKS